MLANAKQSVWAKVAAAGAVLGLKGGPATRPFPGAAQVGCARCTQRRPAAWVVLRAGEKDLAMRRPTAATGGTTARSDGKRNMDAVVILRLFKLPSFFPKPLLLPYVH